MSTITYADIVISFVDDRRPLTDDRREFFIRESRESPLMILIAPRVIRVIRGS